MAHEISERAMKVRAEVTKKSEWRRDALVMFRAAVNPPLDAAGKASCFPRPVT